MQKKNTVHDNPAELSRSIMPFAHWIEDMDGRPVCIWNCQMKKSPLTGWAVLSAVASGGDEVVAVRYKPCDQPGNFVTADAKDALFCIAA